MARHAVAVVKGLWMVCTIPWYVEGVGSVMWIEVARVVRARIESQAKPSGP